jgi:large subunit ribosomal protein L9
MAVEIILLKKVDKLGKAGDLVSVKEGYARNFLLKFDLAMLATVDAKEKAKNIKKKRKQTEISEKKKMQELAEKISGMQFVLKRKAEGEKLFGSVTDAEIIKLLAEKEVNLKKSQLNMQNTIKKIGNYTIDINLSREVFGKIRLKVVNEKK